MEETKDNENTGKKLLSSHLFPFSNYIKCSSYEPYINFKLFNSKFEIVQEFYDINSSQNFRFKQNDTIAFNVHGDYILVQSTQENIKELNDWIESYKTIFINNNIEFKIKLNENIETNLTIRIFENKNNISISTYHDVEITKQINNTHSIYWNTLFKLLFSPNFNLYLWYFINLSKTKKLINNRNFYGKLTFYISKDDANEELIKKILESKGINENLFDLMTVDKFYLDANKILVIKYDNISFSQLLISPEINNFIIGDFN